VHAQDAKLLPEGSNIRVKCYVSIINTLIHMIHRREMKLTRQTCGASHFDRSIVNMSCLR
jgi:hypothetical protein